jgi:Family of unknown function (DUF6279)
MNRISRLARIIGLSLLVLALAGCSAVRVVHGQLPDLAYWWLDGYVDFNELQTPRARRELTTLHAWHRAEELPRYADLLRRLQQMATGPVTPEQVCEWADAARARLTAVARQAEPGAAWLAHSLTPAQLAHLQARFEQNDQTWVREWLRGTPEQRLQRRLDKTVDRAEDFYGRLSEAQIQALRADLARSAFDPQTLWTERLRRQQDVMRSLRAIHNGQGSPAAAREATRALLGQWLESPSAGYRRYAEQSLRENCGLIARLHAGTTPEQRRRAVETLRRYEDDLRSLVAGH